ncbi:MAG: A/G-specific adenine glycosylase [Candidatus Eremiobacteraeota bacterium]|nr:A/G-specific adenine glycosylase [Candidatus Eremiobacteraeota bacterium]MBV8720743.1 A/G-specific adenine glycosylase [Candidatus Eremiobacteraeota bacterium]
MLQQTQVERVVPKFTAFVERFPDLAALARASTADVLRAWKGLGYNTRAVRLKRVAETVIERFGGTMPSDSAALRGLPGIGPYTASAIRAFAFDLDDLPVDTNVRRIAERFGAELSPPRGKAHDWASALMDLGATVCTARTPTCLVCPLHVECKAMSEPRSGRAINRKHKRGRNAASELPFKSSARYARGRVIDRLRELAPGERISLLDLHRDLSAVLPGRSAEDLGSFVAALERDGLIARDGDAVALSD